MVVCEIDWKHRYKTMRLHSASHIMEYFLMKKFPNIERIGSFVNAEKDRSEYCSNTRFENADLLEVEESTNNFIGQENDIILDRSSGVTIWKCNHIATPCCGTHVKNTREIGNIALKRVNKGKGLERVVTTLVTP
jgi:Ser-tRNA(Ala) deacylase AlaX